MQRIDPRSPGRPLARRVRPAALAMAARCATALVGGYAAAAVLATLLARLLPIARVEATLWGMILSFLFYAVIALWCFVEPRLWRAAALVWGVALPGALLLWWLGVRA
ncbi:iron transporter [Sphingomonas adhaesiva]|uniref:iron transporter n=1 Tax=Sphingomonas adhaesiva TaxID=28212 RepID=UPI002FFC5CF8